MLRVSEAVHLTDSERGGALCVCHVASPCQPTDGADDAGVAGGGGLRVDVQQAQVLEEGVGHGGVELLRLDEGGAHV